MEEQAPDLYSVSDNDIDYLNNNVYSFIQIINATAAFDTEPTLNFVKIPNSRWIIYDYGDAISTSAPYGACSVYHQKKVIEEIANLIDKKDWPSIEIVAGTQMMSYFLWIEESKRGKYLTGYTPDERNKKRYNFLTKLLKWPTVKEEENNIVTAV